MRRWLAAAAMAALVAVPARAQEDRVSELERKVEVLIREIEELKRGGVADTADAAPRRGFAPAASNVHGRGLSIGGYGELLFERFDREREDGTPSLEEPRLDFLRSALAVGFKFTDELRLSSEIEIRHAGARPGSIGEVALQFAYLDWALRPELGVRAGMVLVPLGLVNEWREPPVLIGARRPDVEERIIPTPWPANGAGLFGELPGGLGYRAYLTEGLDALRFTAAGGIRDGRQGGGRARARKPAFSGRLDWRGGPGLLLGLSGYTGDAWQEPAPSGVRLTPRVSLLELHARLECQRLQARAVGVRGRLEDAGDLSDQLGFAGMDRLGERFWGFYLEVAYDVLHLVDPETPGALLPYARFERFDTQDRVPGGSQNPAHERRTITTGLGLKPHANVILKADRQLRSNAAKTETSQWNVALGYLF